MNTAPPQVHVCPLTTHRFSQLFSSRRFQAAEIPPIETIPSVHSSSKLAVPPPHFQTMHRWPAGHNPAGSRHAPPRMSPALRLVSTQIMREREKGFVSPLRTPGAADGTPGIFSCRPCWRADRRAEPPVGGFIFPNNDLYCFNTLT